MKHRRLTTLLATAALSLSAGCASTGSLPAWTNASTWFDRGTDASATPDDSAVASSKSRSKESRNEELSPEFRAAQKTFKNTEKTLLAWARYQEDIGEYAEARKMYHELQIAYPKNLEAHLGMARIEILTGRSQQAEQLLSEMKKDYPDNSSIKVELGRLYSQQEEWDKAIREFEDACDVEPDDQNCRYELGVALARAGKFDQALSHLTFAVGAPAANYNIGYILNEQGKEADAAEWIQNALQMHPDQRTAEKAKAMLAKMSTSGDHPAHAVAIAHHARSPESGTAGSRDATVPGHLSPAHQLASQFAPSAVATGRGEPLPVVASGHADDDGIPLPVADAGNVVPGRSVQTSPTGQAPFKTVSFAETDMSGKAAYSSGQPPQWNGPSAPAGGQSSVVPAAPQDPPNWRARKN